MTITNANSHPVKVEVTSGSDMYANSHPYQVEIVGGGGGGEAKVVDELPQEGESGYIYLVLKSSTASGDIYDEYIWALQQDGETYGWEHLGATNEVTITLYSSLGDNTDGAMTQKAVTDSLFSDGATAERVNIGSGAVAGNEYTVAIGANANATGSRAIVIGDKTVSGSDAGSGASSISIGRDTVADNASNIAIGTRASANTGHGGVAIGTIATTSATNGVAISRNSTVTGSQGVAIGAGATAAGDQSIALGQGANATQKGEFNIGTSSNSYGYDGTSYRLITGVHDPVSAQDAATKKYVDGNSGKAKILTTDDYNWPRNNPDGFALWKMEPGLYTLDKDSVSEMRPKYYTGSDVAASALGGVSWTTYQGFIVTSFRNGTDTGNRVTFFAKEGTASVNGASYGSDVVFTPIIDQTTGGSTTRVMSQKATTDTINAIGIRGSGAPTTSTVGSIGTLYEDTTNGKLYQCSAVTESGGTTTYTWVEIGGGGVKELDYIDYNSTYSQTPQKVFVEWLKENNVTSGDIVRVKFPTSQETTFYFNFGFNPDTQENFYYNVGTPDDTYSFWVLEDFLVNNGTTRWFSFMFAEGTYLQRITLQRFNQGDWVMINGVQTTLSSGSIVGLGAENSAEFPILSGEAGKDLQTLLNAGTSISGVGPVTAKISSYAEPDTFFVEAKKEEWDFEWRRELSVFYDPHNLAEIEDTPHFVWVRSWDGLPLVYSQPYAEPFYVNVGENQYELCPYFASLDSQTHEVTINEGDKIYFKPNQMWAWFKHDDVFYIERIIEEVSGFERSSSGLITNGATVAPTTSTVGSVGALYSYVDTVNGNTPHLYICVSTTGGVYTWVEISVNYYNNQELEQLWESES